MFFIYKITNNINGKCYIGSSTESRGLDRRWHDHINNARRENSPSYNYPLQQAIRKYGINNFIYEIVEAGILTLEEREQKELDWIIKSNSLSGIGHGYNQTLYTGCALHDPEVKKKLLEKVSKPCALVDTKETILQVFPSANEAARFIHRDNGASQITKICNGEQRSVNGLIFRWLNPDGTITTPEFQTELRRVKIRAIPVRDQHNFTDFDSILQASKVLNIDRYSIQRCIRGDFKYSHAGGYIFRKLDENNDIIENDIPIQYVLNKYIEINGEYKTKAEWCNYYHISPQAVNYRQQHGMSLIEAITTPKRR